VNILIDIGHPAHVHLFRPFSLIMQDKGHKVLFTYRKREYIQELLESSNFEHTSLGKRFKSISGKIYGLIKFSFLLFNAAIRFKPDIFLSHGSMYASFVSFLVGRPHISMEDSGNMEQIRLYLPFTNVILTPYELSENLGKRQIRYHSFHELAYLSPKYFTPDHKILLSSGIPKGEKFAVIRFVSWDASHDKGQEGFSIQQKTEIVDFLSLKMKVIISSECDIPVSLEKHIINIPPQHIHHLLAYAYIVISEGATMASEAGVLGISSVYVNSQIRCYNEEQENYRTVFNFRNGNNVIDKIKEILESSEIRKNAKRGQKQILTDKIDITAFLVWFIENYPISKRIMKVNPDYQYNYS
jgi:uncharacterized protein